MEMTDLKAAIDDYSDAAEKEILALKNRLDGVEAKQTAAAPTDHAQAYRQCMAALARIYDGTGLVTLYQEDAEHPLSEPQYKQLKEQIEEVYKVGSYSGRPLLLEGGLKMQVIDLSPQIIPLLAAAAYHKDEQLKEKGREED